MPLFLVLATAVAAEPRFSQADAGVLPPLADAVPWGTPLQGAPRSKACRHTTNAAWPWICREPFAGRTREVHYRVDDDGTLDALLLPCGSPGQCDALRRALTRAWGSPVSAGTTMVPGDLAASWTSSDTSVDWIYTPAERQGLVLVQPFDATAFRALWETMRTGWRAHVIGEPRLEDPSCSLSRQDAKMEIWACSDAAFQDVSVAMSYKDGRLDVVGLPCSSTEMCVQLVSRVEWATGVEVLATDPTWHRDGLTLLADVWTGRPTAADFALADDASSGSLLIRASEPPLLP